MQHQKLQIVNIMDIVNRLKLFMDKHSIGSTQFADACRIPRPTLSQILSGRNKKISDEVIAKIHSAYPRLSVLWLLFGEGQMETSANIATTEPQNAPKTASIVSPVGGFGQENNAGAADGLDDDGGLFGQNPLIFDDEPAQSEPDNVDAAQMIDNTGVTIPADGSKSIVSIMVFYSDNSYQSFVPR